MHPLVLAAAYLACTTLAQTPFNFTPPVSGALNVEFAETDVTPGTVVTGRMPQNPPTIGSTKPLNGSYLLAMIDFDNQADLGLIPGNPQALIGGYLHWLQPGIQFSTTPLTPQPANANKTAIYIADAAQAPVVPYLAPQAGNSSKADGHRYVFLLWKELVAFSTPADFPYNNTFRLAFNATRVATDADVGTPLLADWFVYEANATVACKSEYPRPTGTGYSGKPSSYATGRPHWRS